MKLEGLLVKLDHELIQGSVDINVKHIAYHSKRVVEDSLFVCISGFKLDGHDYIDDAIASGATALIVEKPVKVPQNITVILVRNSRIALAKVSSSYYNQPSKQFTLVGVTGTNGKTSTVLLIDRILQAYHKKTGVIGTIENRIGQKVVPTENTTPESLDLQKLFSEMVEENVNAVVMEVSSHALKLHRVKYAKYDVGVFTNLTQDHLDFHETMDAYAKAKAKLFKRCKFSIINIDDLYGGFMLSKAKSGKSMTYSIKDEKADLYAYDIELDITGTRFKIDYEDFTHYISIETPGIFSVYNALAAIGASLSLDVPMDAIIRTLGHNSKIVGRYETIMGDSGVSAVVDYAHTPDGLLNILKTTNDIKARKVITVFGCGGDRDTSKRPQMGKIAGQWSDYAIITSDNPRTEDPEEIINQIEMGMQETKCPYERIVDRAEAINKALSMAEPGDVVIIAGKGHENYQIIGHTKNHFDDKEVVRAYFQEN
ncbi:MAG: UDP-N-acetylmuramoyl-L-alanyl-D-glutamate--2,6-diaminopimelate ligase [Vallitaleaceae bacterium]|nr:UDP-N-acetylmuramoyl-L-alanyl-D-glutamate--2,6-diaminopimelate ligase [Vallitaleaceae bacterium]